MAVSKSQKIQAEIDKVKAKISEQQARLKELEKNKQEAENSEIVDIVRGMSISLEELPLVLQRLRDGTSGQSVQKSEDGGKEGKRIMKRFRVMAAALCAAVLLCGFSVPAYAYADGGEGADYGDPTMTEETPAPEPEPTIEPGEGFSEEGNLVTVICSMTSTPTSSLLRCRRRAGTPFTLSLTMTSPWTRRASSMKPTSSAW